MPADTLWQPGASVEALRLRAQLLAKVRQFFAERNVLEVDTPVLQRPAVSDPFIDCMQVDYRHYPGDTPQPFYLQSSPEYAMKRLLCAGSGCIYQLGKVFRNGEHGKRHNPEFTMLEWYRLGFDAAQLMDEVSALVCQLTDIQVIERISYRALIAQHTQLDIHCASNAEIAHYVRGHIEIDLEENDRDGWLNVLMSHLIEPALKGRAVFVYNYPASQAALARLTKDEQGLECAARFELFVDGVELANGYHELTDASEQRRRFEADIIQRKTLGLPQRPWDTHLVDALAQGMPDCAGVALGFDRLLMLALAEREISRVIPFDFSRV